MKSVKHRVGEHSSQVLSSCHDIEHRVRIGLTDDLTYQLRRVVWNAMSGSRLAGELRRAAERRNR